MPALYPLRLEPQFMERIWGSRSLAPLYDRAFSKPVGEVWLTGDDCKVINGPLAGELIFVYASTVHTVGTGGVLLETQQNSDTTYRLYDYGRARELHVEQALAASKEKTGSGKVVPSGQNGNLNLVSSPCFVVHRRQLKRDKEQIVTRHMPPSSVQIAVGLKGKANISANGQSAELSPGEAVVVPASATQFSIRPEADLDY